MEMNMEKLLPQDTAGTSEVLAAMDVIHQAEKEGHEEYALYRTAKSQQKNKFKNLGFSKRITSQLAMDQRDNPELTVRRRLMMQNPPVLAMHVVRSVTGKITHIFPKLQA